MKNRKWLLFVSLSLNALLILTLAFGYAYVRDQRLMWEMEGPVWAKIAGTVQCIADHDAGTTRYYRLVPVTEGNAERKFTGEHEDGVEIWAWPSYANLGEASRMSQQAFVDAYNRRMKNFVREASTRPSE